MKERLMRLAELAAEINSTECGYTVMMLIGGRFVPTEVRIIKRGEGAELYAASPFGNGAADMVETFSEDGYVADYELVMAAARLEEIWKGVSHDVCA